MTNYKNYFGFKTDPFSNDIPPKKLLQLPGMLSVKERMNYILELGSILVITGDVGSGKSTSLRFGSSHYHKSQVLILNIIANSGSISEIYKQLCWSLDLDVKSASRAFLYKTFKSTLIDIVQTKKKKILLLIDEANLLRPDVFAEIHTLSQLNNDSKSLMAVVFAGQSNLIDKLKYRTSAPLASRVVSKVHLSSITNIQLEEYIKHHLKIAGIKKMLFTDNAITAIYQGSGGILRKVNHLAKGGLIAAAIEKQDSVSSEHVRIAATELL